MNLNKFSFSLKFIWFGKLKPFFCKYSTKKDSVALCSIVLWFILFHVSALCCVVVYCVVLYISCSPCVSVVLCCVLVYCVNCGLSCSPCVSVLFRCSVLC